MSSQTPNATPKRFIAAEFNGRQVAVRRSANYDITLTLVKEAFKPLKSIDEERISISAFIEELRNSMEISKNIWSELLPELQKITVTLDSSSPDSDDSEYDADEVKDEGSEDEDQDEDDQEVDATEVQDLKKDRAPGDFVTPEPAQEEEEEEEFVPTTHRRTVKPRAYQGDPVPLPPTLPPQTGSDTDQKNRVKVFYFHKQRTNWMSAEIITVPTTTIIDLQEYIARLGLFKGFIVAYQFFGETFDHLTYVRELESNWGPKKIQVYMDDRDPGSCDFGEDGKVCEVCRVSVGAVLPS